MGLMYRLRELKNFRKTGIPSDADGPAWERPYETLRKKWVQVPTTAAGSERTTRLLELSDEALVAEWEKARMDITTGGEFAHRGWYHALYSDGMRGKKVMDIGSGFGVDSITFAQHGARLTFVDLVESNLKVLQRICGIMGLSDVRFVLFLREGRPPFSKWGEITDGFGTPWCEPYDLAKLLSMFEPAKFDVVLYQEFHNSDFNWFDLLYRG